MFGNGIIDLPKALAEFFKHFGVSRNKKQYRLESFLVCRLVLLDQNLSLKPTGAGGDSKINCWESFCGSSQK